MADREYITINDAYENNLQHVSLRIPKYKITVFTGVSGSGKSSLVLDTIAARSRRELNDTFPSFVQQYLPKYGRPHVGSIDNLPVAIVIDQKKPASNSRSTVATYTDIHPLLRLLFSRVGQPFVGYSDRAAFCGIFRHIFLQSSPGQLSAVLRLGGDTGAGHPQIGGLRQEPQ